MRTKTLLLSAAALAAGLITASAQVYSVNVVGYINVPLTNGFNLIANQLDVDGTGVNNTLTTSIGTNLPTLTRVYAFNAGTASYATATLVGGNWSGSDLAAVNTALNPGGAVYVSIPASATTPINVTLVGNVMQGTLTTPIAESYQMLSSQVPQAGGVQTDLGYTPAVLDRILQWDVSNQGFGPAHTYTTSWGNGEPQVQVGEGFWLLGHAASTWVRSFSVQ